MGRIAAGAAALGLAAALVGVPAGAEELQGSARIVEVDVAFGWVVLDGERYRVDDGTRIADEHGAELPLASLPSEAGGASGDAVAAWFVAGEPGAGGVRRLLELRLTGAMPR
jgi:hypothetical protein